MSIDDTRSGAVDAAIEALDAYLRGSLEAEDDDAQIKSLETRLAFAFEEAASKLSEYDRLNLRAALSTVGHIGFRVATPVDESVATEASMILRRAYLDKLREEYASGSRELVWPPDVDIEWDELRVAVERFMEAKADDWPPVAFAESPMLTYSAFTSAVQAAQFFVLTWLKTDSREDFRAKLPERLEDARLVVWEQYLQLPAKQ